GRRGVEGDAARSVHRRAAGDRVQPPVPTRRARVGRGRRGRSPPDQPAAAGRDRRRGWRLRLPDHADPPTGLIVASLSLRDFRSYPRLELDLEPGLVLVTG